MELSALRVWRVFVRAPVCLARVRCVCALLHARASPTSTPQLQYNPLLDHVARALTSAGLGACSVHAASGRHARLTGPSAVAQHTRCAYPPTARTPVAPSSRALCVLLLSFPTLC